LHKSIIVLAFGLVFISMIFTGCESEVETQEIKTRKELGILESDEINEASGIDEGINNKNILWTHNDSGDSARVFAIDLDGRLIAQIKLEGIISRDWEDICVGPGPDSSKSYIYVGDIGDNNAKYDDKYIYRFEEPKLEIGKFNQYLRITDFVKITFDYEDGKRDAETLMIDPLTKDLIIASKREAQVNVYRLPFPHYSDKKLIAPMIAKINVTQLTAGDISSDGKKLIMKNYESIFLWEREINQSFEEMFKEKYERLHYIFEPQGEALCFDNSNLGYYTLSEERNNIPARIYYYIN